MSFDARGSWFHPLMVDRSFSALSESSIDECTTAADLVIGRERGGGGERNNSILVISVLQYLGKNTKCYNPCKFGTRSHSQSANNILNSSAQFPVAQKRWASQSNAAEDNNKFGIAPHIGGEPKDDNKDTSGVVYYGPISNTLKHVKLLSLSTCCLSVSLGPVITFMTSTDTNVILKGAVASSVLRPPLLFTGL